MKRILELLEKIEEKSNLTKGSFLFATLVLFTDWSGDVKFEDSLLFSFDSKKELIKKLEEYAKS